MSNSTSKTRESVTFNDMRSSRYDECRQAVEQNLECFRELVAVANNLFHQRRYDASSVYAQIAADYAWHNHPGLFASSQLEEILFRIGLETIGSNGTTRKSKLMNVAPNHVFHVLTQAYGIGGHTRLVWRWIEQDTQRSHSIVFTRQGSLRVPRSLLNSVKAAGGRVFYLDEEAGDLLSRARALREIVASADQVVLHIHPYDVVPAIAFANRHGLPPVIFLNHADHLFWVGATVGDVFAQLRDAAVTFSEERRGIERESSALLPIPLRPAIRTLPKAQAKNELGFSEDTVLFLSIASSYKYAPLFERTFTDVVMPTLETHENAVLLVVGPGNSRLDQFVTGNPQTRGRVKAIDKKEDTSIFYQAADIYLDSFPFTSVTSLLEAASYGLPLVGYYPYAGECEILCGDAPGLANSLIRARTVEQYTAALSRLISDPDFRSNAGEIAKQEVLDKHCGQGWNRFLVNLYLRAAEVSPATVMKSDLTPKPEGLLDILLVGLHMQGGVSCTVEATIRNHVRLLPLDLRLPTWARTYRRGQSLRPSLLLPERLCTTVGKWRFWRQ